jgi:hypothetical protein
MKAIRNLSILFILFQLVLSSASAQHYSDWKDGYPTAWSYDAAPNPNIPFQKELIDLHANMPFFPGVSNAIMHNNGKRPVQKFRPVFGPIPWRMNIQPNTVKILFIGQDATHIAEAAGRPGTAGFGGRAQDLAKFFGVEYSAGFMNAYAYTIRGQYGARSAPVVYNGKVITNNTVVPNDVWMMSNSMDSPIQKWRSKFIEWVIENNKDSLKLIVLFGGAAQDTIGSFVEARGGHVGSKYEKMMKKIQMPEFYSAYAGGNNEFPVAYSKNGGDLYQELLGKRLNYKGSGQKEALDFLKNNSDEAVKKMVLSGAGPYGNGLVHPAQIGGYDLDKIFIDASNTKKGMETRSLKGLTLDSGYKISDDILVTSLPHPTYLSIRMNEEFISYVKKNVKNHPIFKSKFANKSVPKYDELGFYKKVLSALGEDGKEIQQEGYRIAKEKIGNMVERDVAKLRPYADKGWFIEPDFKKGGGKHSNRFNRGKEYLYGRSDIHNVYYDFGTPKNRMVSKSTAQRAGADVIVFGMRGVPKHDKEALAKMKVQKPNQSLGKGQQFTTRVRTPETRYIFDPGPTEKYARLMKQINYNDVYKAKPGMSFSKHGIDAYNIKSHPQSIGDFGHYRGTFKKAKAIILADPDGFDDLITARALTGTRGQYLHGLMDDVGIGEDYIVIKTVPFGMDGATAEEWDTVLKQTADYRTELIREIMKDNNIEMIIADGDNAGKEVKRILNETEFERLGVLIKREGLGNGSGIKEAGEEIYKRFKVGNAVISGEMKNIPKSHLTYYSRIWEGTSGDRVLGSLGKTEKGMVFMEVAPQWAHKQKPILYTATKDAIESMKNFLSKGRFILPSEKISDYVKRSAKNIKAVCNNILKSAKKK